MTHHHIYISIQPLPWDWRRRWDISRKGSWAVFQFGPVSLEWLSD
jgi:hypothetical protein